MTVSAFDYETSARARTGAEVSEPGTVLAPGHLLAEITARLPRQPASLADDGPALALACGSTRYRLHLLPLDTYPELPELPAPAKAALITPAGDDGQDDDAGPAYRHLLMPIRSAG